MADPLHPAARAIRAARAYSGMSRTQLGDRVGVHGVTIGRWERGEWRDGPPRGPMLETIARQSGLLDFVKQLADVSADEPDPARRFAAAARREAEQRNGRPESEPEAPRDEGAEGGAR